MKRIPLTKGKEAIVDDEDYEYLMQWKWHAHKGRYAVRVARRAESVSRKTVRMHRVVADRAGFTIIEHVDHKDGNGLNNQRVNLRPASNQNNMANRGPPQNNTSGYKGVSYHCKRNEWIAQIKVSQRTLFLGYFDSKHDAARAYNVAAVKHFGEFAYQNPV